MHFKYSTTDSSQNEYDSLPRLPINLSRNEQIIAVVGLVDSGATVNVLPYEMGIQLGAVWNESDAIIHLTGNLSNQSAVPLSALAKIATFAPVKLVFAWVKNTNVPLILGQTNFFLEFDVCFYRSKLEFEIQPKV